MTAELTRTLRSPCRAASLLASIQLPSPGAADFADFGAGGAAFAGGLTAGGCTLGAGGEEANDIRPTDKTGKLTPTPSKLQRCSADRMADQTSPSTPNNKPTEPRGTSQGAAAGTDKATSAKPAHKKDTTPG